MGQRFPDTITTALPDVVLVRRHLDDVIPMHEAIEASREHLIPFMPWARVPLTLDEQRERVETVNANANEFVGTIVSSSGEILGGAGLHDRNGPNEIEIGYWVHVNHTRRGIATETARALMNVAFESDPTIELVRLHVDKGNHASGRVPVRLGFEFLGERNDQIDAPAATGIVLLWGMTRQRWREVAAQRA